MNRNIIVSEIAKILSVANNAEDIQNFIIEILTESELETLSKRWQIIKMLSEGRTQRDIAKELKVSLCKVTRGSHILKKKNSISAKYLRLEKQDNEQNKI